MYHLHNWNTAVKCYQASVGLQREEEVYVVAEVKRKGPCMYDAFDVIRQHRVEAVAIVYIDLLVRRRFSYRLRGELIDDAHLYYFFEEEMLGLHTNPPSRFRQKPCQKVIGGSLKISPILLSQQSAVK